MSAPRLTRRLVLERAVRVPDGAGGFSTIWTTLGTVWAEVKAGTGRETGAEFLTRATVPYRVTLRAAATGAVRRPVAGQRFRSGTRSLRILAVAEADAAGLYLTCHCQEEVAS